MIQRGRAEMTKTIVSLIIMVISSCIGLYIGGMLNSMIGGAILFALISGISCIVYTIDNK